MDLDLGKKRSDKRLNTRSSLCTRSVSGSTLILLSQCRNKRNVRLPMMLKNAGRGLSPGFEQRRGEFLSGRERLHGAVHAATCRHKRIKR